MKPYAKFVIVVAVIIGTLAWLAVGGIKESGTYYKEIKEVQAMSKEALEARVRVGGDVEQGSILRQGKEVRFILTQDQLKLPVLYTGTEPLPDTFRDGSKALADGKMGSDGVFRASKIQAKCASKYEGKPQFKKVEPTNSKSAAL